MLDGQKLPVEDLIEDGLVVGGAPLQQLPRELVHALIQVDGHHLSQLARPELVGGPEGGAGAGAKVEERPRAEGGLLGLQLLEDGAEGGVVGRKTGGQVGGALVGAVGLADEELPAKVVGGRRLGLLLTVALEAAVAAVLLIVEADFSKLGTSKWLRSGGGVAGFRSRYRLRSLGDEDVEELAADALYVGAEPFSAVLWKKRSWSNMIG